jgi:hypothetical protein
VEWFPCLPPHGFCEITSERTCTWCALLQRFWPTRRRCLISPSQITTKLRQIKF